MPKRDTKTRQEREKLLLLLNSNAEAPIMSLIVSQGIIKPQHLYYYHCQRFSHLLTSTRLIIAKEETTHNHTNKQRVS